MSLDTLFENAQTLSSGSGAVRLYYVCRKSRVMYGVIYVYGIINKFCSSRRNDPWISTTDKI